MIQSNYPVWRLPRDVRQKLRAAGIKATDLASWAYPITDPPGNVVPLQDRAVYIYRAKPRWSKARKARAAMKRAYPDGMVPADGRRLGPLFADLHDVIFNITPTATPFLMSAGQPASADPARRFPDGQRPTYLDETGKGASAARPQTDIMDALREAVKENW